MPTTQTPQFEVGQVVATPEVHDFIEPEEVMDLLTLHTHGYWDGMDPEDKAENELSVEQGHRIFSAFYVRGRKVWVITEYDRSYTTLLFPHEY